MLRSLAGYPKFTTFLPKFWVFCGIVTHTECFKRSTFPCPCARGSYQVHLVLVDEHPLVHPADDEEGVERYAVLLVVDLGDVLFDLLTYILILMK